MTVRLYCALVLVLVLGWAGLSQAATEIVGDRRGTTPAGYATVTCVDADHCGLDVAIKEGSISLSGADGAITDGVTASIRATVKNYTNSKPLAVIPVDINGDPAAFGGDTELPAAAALADNTANPTVPGVGSFNMCFDGTTWDRCVKADSGAGTVGANTMRTTEATDSQLSADMAAVKAAVQLMDDDQVGATNRHYISVGTTEDEVEVKATAGRVMSIQVSNSAATVAYMRCAQLTATNTTPGTSTVFWGMAIPGATTGAGMTANFGPAGMAFTPALTCWVVTDKAETGVTEVAAGDIQWNIQYK